jgi:Arc/MetJ-type ribon-helix-helix transcriptional regulator
MASISLGEHFEKFVRERVAQGRYRPIKLNTRS